MTDYLELADDLLIAEAVLGVPAEVLEFRHRWDGRVGLASGQGQSVGLPPSGPARIVADACYQLSPGGDLRSTRARMDTQIVGGWDDERPHPMEVVDAALADPTFAALMDGSDFNRADAGFITFDSARGIWYVGSCGSTDELSARWRLAGVDPVIGEVLGIVDGAGIDASCNPGTWPDPQPTTGPEAVPSQATGTPAAAPSDWRTLPGGARQPRAVDAAADPVSGQALVVASSLAPPSGDSNCSR